MKRLRSVRESRRDSEHFNWTRRELLINGGRFGAGAAAASFLSACGLGSSSPSAQELTTFSWGYGYQETANDLIVPEFQKKYPDSDVSLQVGTNADMYSKIVAQRNNAVISGGTFNYTYAYRGQQDELWTPFDRSSLPNASDIDFKFSPDTGGIAFGVMPYGVAFNPKYVDPPESILDIFDPKYKGKVGGDAAAADIYMLTALAIGKDLNDVPAGIMEWGKHKDLLGPWSNSPADTNQLLDSGELWYAPGYGGLVGAGRDSGLSVEFVIPEEGATPVADIVQLIAGFDDETTQATQDFLGLYLSSAAEARWPNAVNTSPVNKSVSVAPDVSERPEYVAIEDFDKLHTYDFEKAAANIADYQALIDQELKS